MLELEKTCPKRRGTLRQTRRENRENETEEEEEANWVVREAQRSIHRLIRRVKRSTWQKFLQNVSDKEVWLAGAKAHKICDSIDNVHA